MLVRARAPGKLVIAGEYAVLAGAPGIALAVPPLAEAIIRQADVARLSVTGCGPASKFVVDDSGHVTWRNADPGDNGRLLVAAAGVLAPRSPRWAAALNTIDATLNTRSFRAANGAKLGLGSSAAITVAFAAALSRLSGANTCVAEIFDIAGAIHRQLQGGEGSGIDIAASTHGGCGIFQSAEWHPVDWPGGLHGLAIWTGKAASTSTLVSRYRAAEARGNGNWRTAIDGLCECVTETAAAWRSADGAAVLGLLEACSEQLARLDAAGEIGIFTAAHRRLARFAERCSATYKPSGAGGGDFGLAFADSAAKIVSLEALCEQEGFQCRALAPAVSGVQVDAPAIPPQPQSR